MVRGRKRAKPEGKDPEMRATRTQIERKKSHRSQICHVSLPGVEKKVSLRRSQIDQCFHCPRCGAAFDDTKLIQEHTSKRCASGGRSLRLKFPVKQRDTQGRDGESDDIQYLFTRTRSMEPDDVDVRTVQFKLESGLEVIPDATSDPQAGPSSVRMEEAIAPVTQRAEPQIPPSSSRDTSPFLWELLYPAGSRANDTPPRPPPASPSPEKTPSIPPTSSGSPDLEGTFLRIISNPIQNTPTPLSIRPVIRYPVSETPPEVPYVPPTVPHIHHFSLPPPPPTATASPVSPNPTRVSQQPSPPHSTPPLSPRDTTLESGPSDLRRSLALLSQSSLAPSPLEPIVNSLLILHSSTTHRIPPPLSAFFQTLSEPLDHLAEVFVEMGFLTDHRLDVLCRKPESWIKVEARIETKGTFADWLIIEEGLEARARGLAARDA